MFAPSHRPPVDVQSCCDLHVFSFYRQLLFDSGRWLVDWLAQAAGWSTGRLVGRLAGWLVDLVDDLVDKLTQVAGWSTGWLIDLSKTRKIFRLY